jgi:hypothetical protein
MRRMQETRRPLYEQTRVFKAYLPSVVPGWLQTAPYARALLSAITEFRGTPDDIDEAVAARMKRNRIVDSGNHRFALVLEETVLRYRIGGPGYGPLEELRHHRGSAYDIRLDGGRWTARRRDGKGGTLADPLPAGLGARIAADHRADPVPRDLP